MEPIEEEEEPGVAGSLRGLLRAATLRQRPSESSKAQGAPRRLPKGTVDRPRPANVRLSFTEKIDFFESSAFLHRRASMRASLDPSAAADLQQQLLAAVAEEERLRSEETTRRLTAIAGPTRNALLPREGTQRPSMVRGSKAQGV